MLFDNVCIESMAHLLPEETLTSAQIEERLAPVYNKLNLPFGRLEFFTGIQERRLWHPDACMSDKSAEVGVLALKKSGVSRKDIGILINGSVYREYMEPATASFVHEKIQLGDDTMIFDVSNACLGFLNGMVIVGSMIDKGIVKAGMVVASENGRPLVDTTIKALRRDWSLTRRKIKGSFASLTIGCGSAAAVLVHKSISKHGHRLLGGECMVSSTFNYLCRGGAADSQPGTGDPSKLLMDTDSERLMVAGCDLARKTWERTRDILQFENDDVNRIFCHQVGRAHRRLMLDTLELDSDKDFCTYPFLGNIGSVSLPATFSIGIERDMVQQDDFIALLGIGSGINCMMLGVRW